MIKPGTSPLTGAAPVVRIFLYFEFCSITFQEKIQTRAKSAAVKDDAFVCNTFSTQIVKIQSDSKVNDDKPQLFTISFVTSKILVSIVRQKKL